MDKNKLGMIMSTSAGLVTIIGSASFLIKHNKEPNLAEALSIMIGASFTVIGPFWF